MDEHLLEQFNAEIRAILSEAPPRPGWKRSKIDQQTRDFVLQREAAIEATLKISHTAWQSINAQDRALAEEIRHNVLHALTVMVRAMARNEENFL